ncbi:MAG: hypothetical protein PHF74_08575, partial [Dehalococcoidales bacterium]|nr:hypothetical protein [Dehalococcoidales bacterium]
MGNKGKVSGILSIISGVFGLIWGTLLIIIAIVMGVKATMVTVINNPDGQIGLFILICGIFGITLLLIGVLSIIGGVYSVKRKYWGLGLAAAVTGM